MRALSLTAPRSVEVVDAPEPSAAPGEVVIEVALAGVCGTDVELYEGTMPYLVDGRTRYPVQLGHESCGTVVAVGDGVDPAWRGRRVMGDTMLGCGRCRRCRRGLAFTCAERQEVGILGRPGALAERFAMPARSLHALPDVIDDRLGALVEPGANGLRAARATECGEGDRVLVVGPGTIGLLTAMFLRATGAEVHVLGELPGSLAFVTELGLGTGWTADTLPAELPFDAVVDCTDAAAVPAQAVERVQPGGRVVLIGIAPEPSRLDSRQLVLRGVTAVGVLSASPGLADTIEAYASGEVDPRPLVAATVGLEQVGEVLGGGRPAGAGPGPKVLVDPRAGVG